MLFSLQGTLGELENPEFRLDVRNFQEVFRNSSIYFKLLLSFFDGLLMRHCSFSNQDLSLVSYYLSIQSLNPILHRHRIHLQSLKLRKIKESGHKKIESQARS